MVSCLVVELFCGRVLKVLKVFVVYSIVGGVLCGLCFGF